MKDQSRFPDLHERLQRRFDDVQMSRRFGHITALAGLVVTAKGLDDNVSLGDQAIIHGRHKKAVPAEIVGFGDKSTYLMVYGTTEGIGPGCRVDLINKPMALNPDPSWLGRVIDPLGNPLDGKGPLPSGRFEKPIRDQALPAHQRSRMGDKIDLGVRAMNTFTTMCAGQRMGIFAGSGVGKSILMSMLARYTKGDVNVIGLVGERGREVQEFIEDDLGEEGLKHSIVVVATSDQPPLIRRLAGYTTMAMAEYFRDEGHKVLCLMDSVTRFAMSQREIGLSAGEPPTSKGYPPTTFNELARLLERAGPGLKGSGSITGLFTVLVEGDDHNEPIADAVRGIIDGHIVLDRDIGQRGRYPAIDVLKSVSRAMPRCNNSTENELINKARQVLATYEDMAELIRLGAYKHGSDAKVDEAIALYDKIEAVLAQAPQERSDLNDSYAQLATAMGVPWDAEEETDNNSSSQSHASVATEQA